MFLVRHATNAAGTAFAVIQLVPGPTEVDYPERRDQNVQRTQDRSVVIQRPVSDGRPRKWIWRGYPSRVVTYESLWRALMPLDSRSRMEAGLPASIYIWESESGEGGFDETTNGQAPNLVNYYNLRWTKVRFLQVTRKSRKGGGPVHYDESVIEFVIDDPNYRHF